MRIVVFLKQTPDSAAKVEVKDGHVTWGDSPLVVNPWDEYAVEEAIRLKEKHGGTTTAISMGPESARDALKEAIALGCDEAILISDPALKGSDTLATAMVLAKAVEKLGDVSLALFGKQAIDGDTGQTPVQTARKLGWPALTYAIAITEFDANGKTITMERALEEGRQVVKSKLPAVISVVKEINEPRFKSFMGIKRASKAQIPVWTAADLGLDPSTVGAAGSRVKWPKVYAPPPREGSCEIITGGSPEEIAGKLMDRLMADKVI